MTKSNNSSLKEIAARLMAAGSVLIFPHLQMDGDTLGSSAALCRALRNLGKNADILIEDKIPVNLAFLDDGLCIDEYYGAEPDICIAVDCSDLSRIEKRRELFQKGKSTAFIDHHITAKPFADYNYVDSQVSSTGEIIYKLLMEMGVPIDKSMAEALYAAIATDTGNFQYSNTSKDTHLIVAALYDTGMDHNKITLEIYQKKRIEKVKIVCAIMQTMELILDGKASIAVMTQEMLRQTGADPEETEGIVEELRNIDGVEISAFLREEEDRVRVTMRAKSRADVSEIARSFGGGGHTKAAGCTISGSIDVVKPLITEAIASQLDSMEG